MMVVVADTSPLNYLVQIEAVDLLPGLYGRIVIAREVLEELDHPRTPVVVSQWIQQRPPWLEIRSAGSYPSVPGLLELGAGERAAIELAQAEAALLLIDDADGRKHASRLGLSTVGTLGVLRLAAIEGLVDLRVLLDKLMQTNFRAANLLISQLIIEDEERRRSF